MIGVLDSGIGGLNSISVLRDFRKNLPIVFLKDEKNAPYGTKSREELIHIVRKNIENLKNQGCEIVLLACCTASTVWEFLDDDLRNIAVPIIRPTARCAMNLSLNKRIAVLATDRTVKSHAFRDAMKSCFVREISAQPLVKFAESGESSRNFSPETYLYLKMILSKEMLCGCDTLILGCTHFPYFEEIIFDIAKENGVLNIVNSAKCGADEVIQLLKNK